VKRKLYLFIYVLSITLYDTMLNGGYSGLLRLCLWRDSGFRLRNIWEQRGCGQSTPSDGR